MDYWGLFLASFLASTLLPGGSEVVLGLMAQDGQRDPLQLLLVATAGNTLGSLTSWSIGWLIAWRYPAAGLLGDGRQRALARVRRWGTPVLLLAWLPVIGDPLCVAAGWLRLSLALSVLFIAIGKAARYGVLLWLLA